MALKVPRPASLLALDALKTAWLMGASLRLFKNNITPGDADVAATYTEANFTGYAPITLNSWGAAFLNAGNKAESDEINRVFTQTGVGVVSDVYGYYVLTAGGLLMFAERNPGGLVVMDTAGKTYSVLPRFTGISEF